MTTEHIESFKTFIWSYYQANRRDFAWRLTCDPYAIMISEVMLQQTQTFRVIPKYELWLAEFPDFVSLASASLRDVLSVWQGLGYNRRGMYLQQTAQRVVAGYNGVLPDDPEILETFSGIGKNTAASICAFAFNKPVVFIETNIRTVFIHSFFRDQAKVHDKELMPLIAQTVDQENPREWYYALMDYGVFLKQQGKNPSRKSVHHTKQSRFEGSHRQVRGAILRVLDEHTQLDLAELIKYTNKESSSVEKALKELKQEGFLKKTGLLFSIQ